MSTRRSLGILAGLVALSGLISSILAADATKPTIPSAAKPLLTLPDDVFARPEDDAAVDVLLFARDHAALVRVNVTIGGLPFRRSWREFLQKLHTYLDRNSDGVLTTAEANAVPWTQVLVSPIFGNPGIRTNMNATRLDAAPGDGVVTLAELDAYLRDAYLTTALNARPGAPKDERAEAIYGQLDQDHDGKLAPSERAAGEALMGRLDSDEDEYVSLDELTPEKSASSYTRMFVSQNNTGTSNPKTDAAIFLDPPGNRGAALRRLLYDKGENTKGKWGYPVARLVADPAGLKEADADHDGRLDQAELERFLDHPRPAVIASFALPAPGPFTAAPLDSGNAIKDVPVPLDPRIRVERGEGGGLSLLVDDVEFATERAESNRNFDSFLESQFMQADSNNDGKISQKESRGNRIFQVGFLLIDWNKDDVVTRDEYDRYLALSRESGQMRLMATLAERGTGVFQRFDTDNDSRLSLRELRKGGDALARLDRNHDGVLTSDELPRRFSLGFGRGENSNQAVFAVSTSFAVPAGGRNNNGPAWFRGMDRNGDGDVSPREFLGAVAVFRQLDRDSDGLIDAKEAAQLP